MIFWHIWLWAFDHPIAGGWALLAYFTIKPVANFFLREDPDDLR